MKKKKCFNCGYWNAGDASYCTLCYEPLNKTASRKSAAKPPAPAPAAPAPVPLGPLLLKAALLALLAAGAGAWVFINARQAATEASARPGGLNRFKEKTGAADKLLADYIHAKEGLLAEIAAGPADPEGFGIAGQYTARLFSIEEDYAAAISALQLPRRSAVDKTADAFYLEWEEIHRHRETAAMEDFGERYGKLAEQAAGQGG